MNKMRAAIVAFIVIFAAGAIFYYSTRFNRTGSNTAIAQSAGHQGHGQTPAAPKAETPAASESAAKEEPPTIEIPVEKQQLIGVRTTPAAVMPLRKIVRTVGIIEYDERKLTTINTKVEGWIEKLYVNYTGTYVKKGDRMADIYSPELWATQQEFINLVRWSKKTTGLAVKTNREPADANTDFANMISKDAGTILEAARKRLKLWDISDAQIRKIEQSETPIRTLTVYSPVSGYVLQRYAVQGMKIMAGEKLLDVADLSNVWVVADIYEYEFPFIKVGDTAKIRLNSFPGKELTSRVEFVSPTMSAGTRTMKVRFSIPNPGGQLRPQMFADVELAVELGKKLALPDEAVIDTGVRKIVYIDKGDGNFEPRQVLTGARAEKMIEITSGLKAGEKVASSANFLIDSEAKLKGIEAPQTPAPGAKPGSGATAPKSTTPPAGGHRH
ncbi:MAG: efflux RND transporter periplasmic adaptor subunit [Syntrophorhabdaceae bacterium]